MAGWPRLWIFPLLGSLLLAGCTGPSSSRDSTPFKPTAPAPPNVLFTTLPPGMPVPKEYTCDRELPDAPPSSPEYPGEYVWWVFDEVWPGQLGPAEPDWPPFVVAQTPPEARSVAGYLRDATAHDYVQWIFWDLPPGQATVVPPSESWWTRDPGKTPTDLGGKEGRNGAGGQGYEPLCPTDLEVHRFAFTAYVLEANLSLPAGSAYDQFAAELAAKKVLVEKTAEFTYRRADGLRPGVA